MAFSFNISAPISMGVVLAMALAFAVGHHAFYQRLNGQFVNVSIGTFFAFLVKSFLGVAVSTVFDQFAWRHLIKAPSTKIGVIDDFFSALRNGFQMANPNLWRHYPLGMLLATIVWLLPVASVITPATLNVQLAPFSNSSQLRVPRIDFSSVNFVNLYPVFTRDKGTNSYTNMYRGPMPEVQRVVTSAAMQGSILNIQPPSTNSSWTLDFHGPALKCVNVNSSLHAAIVQDVQSMINESNSNIVTPQDESGTFSYGFLSWTPYISSTSASLPSFNAPPINFTAYSPRLEYLGPKSLEGPDLLPTDLADANFMLAPDPLSIFLAAFPHVLKPENGTFNPVSATTEDATIVQCTLYNATYSPNFTYANGEQRINIPTPQLLNEILYIDQLVMTSTGGEPTYDTAMQQAKSYQQLFETFTYQSVMESFGKLLVGAITERFDKHKYNDTDGAFHSTTTLMMLAANTSVMSTKLGDTKELASIRDVTSKGNILNTFQHSWQEHSVSQSKGNTSTSFLDTVEEMFHNITISLMSSALFQPNYKTPSSPPNVSVTITTYRNIYTYSQSILWTAYGIAIGVTLSSICLGVFAYFSNHGSYTTKFSTILRTAKYALLSTEPNARDCNGMDPLPGYIAETEISFMGKKVEEEVSEGGIEEVQMADEREDASMISRASTGIHSRRSYVSR